MRLATYRNECVHHDSEQAPGIDTSMTTEHYSVDVLRAYLLGQLPATESERLDELSITDEECAERIRSAEHDLVDAFVRGELQGAALEQFRSTYLMTPRGRDAVQFAEALQSLDEKSVRGASREAGLRPSTLVLEQSRWPERLALAAAVVILATASVWLVLDNRLLRSRVTSIESSRDELLRERQLRDAQARPPADTSPRAIGQGSTPLTVATLVLAPQLRSARQLPTVTLGDGASELPVRLDLEPVDFPAYEASLVAPGNDRPLWRADRLTAHTVGGRQIIDLRLPATVLTPQEYLIRVSGVPARGPSEIVGEYRFTVAR